MAFGPTNWPSNSAGSLQSSRLGSLKYMLLAGLIVLGVVVFLVGHLGSQPKPVSTQQELIDAASLQEVLLTTATTYSDHLSTAATEQATHQLETTLAEDNQLLMGQLRAAYDVGSISASQIQAATNPDADGLLANALSAGTFDSTYQSIMASYLGSLVNTLKAAEAGTEPGSQLAAVVAEVMQDSSTLYGRFGTD